VLNRKAKYQHLGMELFSRRRYATTIALPLSAKSCCCF